MKVDITSMFFNSSIEGKTATPAWRTSLGQSKVKECRFEVETPGLIDIIVGLTYKMQNDLSKLDRNNISGELLVCSVFNKIYVNSKPIDGALYTLLLLKETSTSHNGRLQLCYSPHIVYNGYKNSDTLTLIQQMLGVTTEGCWFVHDISIKNQDELHFAAVVVDSHNPTIYKGTSQERSNYWRTLIPNSNILSSYSSSLPLQQIFYGAPGTGKSHKVKEVTDSIAKEFVFRTTFHPDSDYSTFVGAYKPTMKQLPIYNQQTGAPIGVEDKIVYSFVPQAFLKAYVAAWQNPEQHVFLVIEEINRGNCAQIFGDIFQLLDRKDNGESKYPIKADQDIQDYLAKEFAGVEGLEDNIQSGEELMLPANLHIWATMNTSDQSLFPIDSAFKRRWDWKYVPIQDGGKKWGIKVAGLEYDWWSFLRKINDLIDSTTNSEDKKLGYFFCKPDEGECITADRFVNKVIFYLWNDVFKDYDISHEEFKDENKRLAFGKFFNNDGSANENQLDMFLDKLGVSQKDYYIDDEEETEETSDLTPELKSEKKKREAAKSKEFWPLFDASSDLQKLGFNKGTGYVRDVSIGNNTYLIELPRYTTRESTKNIKLVALFDKGTLSSELHLPELEAESNIQWWKGQNPRKDRIELRLTDVDFDNLIVHAQNDLFKRLEEQLNKFVNFIEKEVPSTSNAQ